MQVRSAFPLGVKTLRDTVVAPKKVTHRKPVSNTVLLGMSPGEISPVHFNMVFPLGVLTERLLVVSVSPPPMGL
jgi:hypothetical protein